MRKRNRWNPHGLPSPASLGFVKGARVGNVYFHPSQRPHGVVLRVYPNCIVVREDSGMRVQCHPSGRYILTEAEAPGVRS